MNNKNEAKNNTSLKEKKLTEKYVDSLPLRLIIQNIPHIGSSLDTVLSEMGNKWREKRLQMLLQNFNDKIRAIDMVNDKIISEMQKKIESEDFYDLFLQAAQISTLTHRENKIDRFANLLKNFLVNEKPAEDYLIEVFFNITNELTENEIRILSDLQYYEIEIYYNHRDKPFDIKRYISIISEQESYIDNNIPHEYNFHIFYMYGFNRLEKFDLIKSAEGSSGSLGVDLKTSNQGESSPRYYKRKDIISLSEFGEKYIDWILK